MNSKKIFLAVDLGASSGRLIAGSLSSTGFELEEIHRFPNQGVRAGNRLLWDWLGLWQHIKDALRIAGNRFKGDEIVSVGVDTWGVDFSLMGKDGDVIGSPICYRDSQTQGIFEEAFKVCRREEIFDRTGLQFIEFNSLFQLYAIKKRNPELLDQAERFLMMPDLFHWLLCGEMTNESTDASTSQLIDPRTIDWASDVIEKFGIPTEIFGEIVQPGTSIGKLRPELADELGLPQIQVVVPASHDTASAVAAVPVQSEALPTPNWCYVSSGTWSCVGVELQSPRINQVVGDLNFTNEGGVEGTTRLLKNVAGMWLVQECRRIWEREGREFDWENLVRLAEDSPRLGSHVPPDHPELMAPANMPQAIASICEATGQTPPADEGQMIRCTLESISLRYRMVLEWLEQITEASIDRIHIVGGGTQNRLLNQLAADATGREVITGPIEATAIGNLMMQMVGAGELANVTEGRQMVANNFPLETYEPGNEDGWDEAYEKFKKIAD